VCLRLRTITKRRVQPMRQGEEQTSSATQVEWWTTAFEHPASR
jgi:hypothetical protein